MTIDVSYQNVPNMQKYAAPQRHNVAFTSFAAEERKGNKALLYTALAALAAGGIFIATRGKKMVKPNMPLKPNIPENLTHMDMDLFKQFGKFEKGKAIFNGKEFTGSIYTKNGYELRYYGGRLSESKGPRGIKYYSDGKLRAIEHNYYFVGDPKTTIVERHADGTRVITKKRGGYDNKYLDNDINGNYKQGDKNHDIVTTIKPDGTVTRLTRNLETYANGLEQKYTYDKLEHLNSGKRELIKKGVRSTVSFHEPMRQQRIVDGKKVTEELNEKGEVIESWITEFNPKNNVSSQVFTEKGKVPRTIFRDKQGNVLEKCGADENTWYYFWNENKPNMGKYSTLNPYGSGAGVSKEKILELIQKENLPFEV